MANTLTIAANPGSRGTYNLHGGGLSADTIRVKAGGDFNVIGATTTVTGDVINSGTIKTDNATVIWGGTFTNSGTYISDLSDNYFTDLLIGRTGSLVSGWGDSFLISNDFINESSMYAAWDTRYAQSVFTWAPTMFAILYLPGTDCGACSWTGYNNNFTWGTLDLTGQIPLSLRWQ